MPRSGLTAAQIRNQVSAAFSSVEGTDGKGTVAFPGVIGSGGALMLTQAMTPAGIGARVNPTLVINKQCTFLSISSCYYLLRPIQPV